MMKKPAVAAKAGSAKFNMQQEVIALLPVEARPSHELPPTAKSYVVRDRIQVLLVKRPYYVFGVTAMPAEFAAAVKNPPNLKGALQIGWGKNLHEAWNLALAIMHKTAEDGGGAVSDVEKVAAAEDGDDCHRG